MIFYLCQIVRLKNKRTVASLTCSTTDRSTSQFVARMIRPMTTYANSRKQNARRILSLLFNTKWLAMVKMIMTLAMLKRIVLDNEYRNSSNYSFIFGNSFILNHFSIRWMPRQRSILPLCTISSYLRKWFCEVKMSEIMQNLLGTECCIIFRF